MLIGMMIWKSPFVYKKRPNGFNKSCTRKPSGV